MFLFGGYIHMDIQHRFMKPDFLTVAMATDNRHIR